MKRQKEILCYKCIASMEYWLWHKFFTESNGHNHANGCDNHVQIWEKNPEWWSEFRLPDSFPAGYYAIEIFGGSYTVYNGSDVQLVDTNYPWEYTRDIREREREEWERF